jgi:hypothetical protein
MALRTHTFAYPWSLRLITAAALLTGCPGDDTEGETAAETEGEPTGTGSTDASGTDSMTSAGSQSGTSTTSTTTSSTNDTTATGDGSSTGADDTAGTTTGADKCDGLPRNECTENEACTPIACSPYQEQMIGETQWCLGEPAYIGCRSADLGCAEVRTVACGPEDTTVVCSDACLPGDFMECDPPVQGDVPMCE